MSDIQPITQEEWDAARFGGRGRGVLSLEAKAVIALKPNSGLKMPCRWKHGPHNGCGGAGLLYKASARHGFKVHTSCREGIMYAWRDADKE